MSKRGQPPVEVSAETLAAITAGIAAGVDNRHAVEGSGISLRTFYRLKAAGKAGTDPKAVAFLTAVKKAEADAVAKHVRNITAAADAGTWTASAWWLERRHPDLYGSDRKRVRELEKLVVQLEAAILGGRRGKR